MLEGSFEPSTVELREMFWDFGGGKLRRKLSAIRLSPYQSPAPGNGETCDGEMLLRLAPGELQDAAETSATLTPLLWFAVEAMRGYGKSLDASKSKTIKVRREVLTFRYGPSAWNFTAIANE